MKSIVITGSTRGIGYGLADSFLTLGCEVMISGRNQNGVDQAIERLKSTGHADRVHGQICDVTRPEQVQALWNRGRERFGKIDIWINNAGVGHAQREFWTEPPEEIRSVVETNIAGLMYGARIALSGMREQGFGSLYNMEGLGSDGRKVDGLTLYGSTKSCVRYLTGALAEEVKGSGVIVGALSPGMVVTDFLTRWYEKGTEEWERAKRVFNILADKVETVTPWLAKKILENKKNGARISWLTGPKVMTRFLSAPLRKRELFENA
jgi:NAD(P)-dependent dehydrogenase (short-subunit alcohol dehydrogenase family)